MLDAMTEGARGTGDDLAIQPSDPGSAGLARAPRIAVLGVSVGRTCGVRDHATLLAEALERDGLQCSSHWLWRSAGSLRAARSEMRRWNSELEGELRERKADVVLLHYSVFSYSFRGVPLFVHPTLSCLRGTRIPIVSVMHEFAYPWMYGGWRGAVWAVTQRAVLIDVMRASAGVLVTDDSRASWLRSRPWLARRPVEMAPVFSNLPAPEPAPRPVRTSPLIGLFGFSYQGAAVALVLDALVILAERGQQAQLALLGAAGRSSPAGRAWLHAAASRGLQEQLSFSGALPAQELSNTLAACDVLLGADTAGPSSRKGTLAASLASGSPVIAIDGPRAWSALSECAAAEVVPPTAEALADAVSALLADERSREELGARGRAFAERQMGVSRTVSAVRSLLGQLPRTRDLDPSARP
jgi:glycosyltransferase involved in cell wall biosynthesis